MEARHRSRWLGCGFIILPAASTALAQQSPPAALQSAVVDARATAEAGDYPAAFAKGIAALETCPEAQWDRETLRAFAVRVGEHGFPKLSPEQKQSALAALADPKSAAAKAVKAYALWRTKQGVQALALLMPLRSSRPASPTGRRAGRRSYGMCNRWAAKRP